MNPLYALKGIIYLIENTVTGQRYVGQTIHSFATRYHGCRWWKGTNNPYLKAAAAKYGPEAFQVTILEHSQPLEELNRLEAEYAQRWNTYAPGGYNLVQCGDNKRPHPTSVAKRARTLVLNDPSGRDVVVSNVRQHCREHGLCNRSFCRMLKGELASCGGWTLQGVTAKHHRNNRRYVLYEPDGKRHEVIGLTGFCRDRGLDYWRMRDMVQGKTAQSQGFALSVEAFGLQRRRHVVTLVGHGREVTLTNIKRDCGALGLHSSLVYRLIAGKIASYKGWTIKRLGSTVIERPLHNNVVVVGH